MPQRTIPVSGLFQGAPAKESAMTDHVLPYGGGSMPETKEEQRTVMDACYSIISADPLDAAVDMAKGCPVPQGGATITVYETFGGDVRVPR
jgi:hypothetical protein